MSFICKLGQKLIYIMLVESIWPYDSHRLTSEVYMKFSTILIAADLDPRALPILKKVKDLGLPKDAKIELVHVMEMSLAEHFLPSLRPSADELAQIEKLVLKELSELKGMIGLSDYANVSMKCLISPNAKQDFLHLSEDLNADLIIAAAKEREGLKGVFEGSFTNFLNKFCSANLLTLR